MAFSLSLEEFQAFHTIDRQVYARLVINLGWEPYKSRKIMAFWYWLETICYTYFVKEMQQVPDALLNAFAHEAITCLNCLYDQSFTQRFIDNDRLVPLTRNLVSQDFSLGFVYENREDVISKIVMFMMEVCGRAFSDIVPSNLADGVQYMVTHNESLVLNGGNVTNGVQSLVPYSESSVLNGRNVTNGVQSWVQSLVPYSESSVLNGRNVANVVQSWVPNSEPLVINGRNVDNVVQSWAPDSESSVLNGRNVANVVQSWAPNSEPLVTNGRNVDNLVQSWVPNSESFVLNGRNVADGVESLVSKSEYLVNNGQILVPHSESQSQFSHGLQDNECHSRMGISQAAANVTQDLPSTAPDQDDRTLYITFSKGLPITKQELKDHVTRIYGDCVEEIYLQIHPQPFANVIVRSPSVLEEILGDNVLVKLSINGKDAWARRNDYLFTGNRSRLAV